MDIEIYPESVINRYMYENLFFKDDKLKKYYERNEARDLNKFRTRVHTKFGSNSFEKMMYVFVTDSIRDIILETTGELTEAMKSMGDLIVSGGEAFNLYVDYKERIVTGDIDAKFIPRIPVNSEFFGKLQAIKLILWDKLGEIAKKLNIRVKNRISSMQKKHPKLFKFMGIGFKKTGPYVTRRYTLIKKKKTGDGRTPSKGDIFIDVELFALDLNIRYFSPEFGKITDSTMGGILDIPFMRPGEFGHEVALTRRKGIAYRNKQTGRLVVNNKLLIASKEFLIEDIYLMNKLKLRPEKKEKDRVRLMKLARLFDKRIKSTDTIDKMFKMVRRKIAKTATTTKVSNGRVSMKNASNVDPYKYKKFTTIPMKDRLSKQFVHGLKTIVKNVNVPGYNRSNGNQRFNLNKFEWVKNDRLSYVKNELNLRPTESMKLPNNIPINKTLYGFNPRRNIKIPRKVLNKSAAIPFVGLKK